MKIQIIGNEIFAGGEKVATFHDDPRNSSTLDAFKYDLETRFRYGMRTFK